MRLGLEVRIMNLLSTIVLILCSTPTHSNSFQPIPAKVVLRREVEQLRMERDILKKAVAFFAKESS